MGNMCQPPIRSDASKQIRLDDFDSSSERSLGEGSEGSVIYSLHTNLTREVKHRDVNKYYEVLEQLGVGSMGSVSRARKRSEAVGGSARKLSANSRHRKTGSFEFPFSSWVRHTPALDVSCTSTSSVCSRRSSGSVGTVETSSTSASSRGHLQCDPNYRIEYALKSINLSCVSNAAYVKELENEIDILRVLDHPNIVRPFETFSHRRQLYMVMELCSGGDLYARDPYTEEQARKIIYKVISAVSFMHRCGITHRDIKFENILFENESKDAEVKIVDFGLSKKYFGLRKGPGEFMDEGVGTVYSMSPEVLQGRYTNQADLWSVGVIAFMLLSSQMPFYGKKREHVFQRILHGIYQFQGQRWHAVSEEAKDFVCGLLQVDTNVRMTACEALQHPWLNPDARQIDPSSNAETTNAYEMTLMDRDCHGQKKSIRQPSWSAIEVHDSMEDFCGYKRLKKLALMIIAYKSTSEEIGFLRKSFDKYNTTHDGTITFEQFKMAMSGFAHSEEELRDMFDSIDLDASGMIHYTEFIAATLEARGAIVEERIAEAFDRLDSDDTGYISKKNLHDIIGDGGFMRQVVTDKDIQEIIDEVDLDHDSKISYDDFLSLWGVERQCRDQERIGCM